MQLFEKIPEKKEETSKFNYDNFKTSKKHALYMGKLYPEDLDLILSKGWKLIAFSNIKADYGYYFEYVGVK